MLHINMHEAYVRPRRPCIRKAALTTFSFFFHFYLGYYELRLIFEEGLEYKAIAVLVDSYFWHEFDKITN